MSQASVGQLFETVCAARGVSKEKVSARNIFLFSYRMIRYIQLFDDVYKQARIWDYFQKSKSVLLDPLSEKTLEESCLQIDQDVSVLAHGRF